jgi:hypothetical protein
MSKPDESNHTRDLLNLISRTASKAKADARDFGIEATGTFVPPLGEYLKDKRLKQLMRQHMENTKDELFAQNVKARETRFIEKGAGPLKRTVVAEPQGTQWYPHRALPGLDGEYHDVSEHQLAIINTFDNVMHCLDEHAGTWLVNSDLGAELGSISAVLPSPEEEPDAYALAYPKAYLSKFPVRIGLLICKVQFQDPAKMWKIIDPLTAAVTLLGPRLGEVAVAGTGALGHQVAGAAPAVVDQIKATTETSSTVKERIEQATELVRGDRENGAIDVGEDVFAVQFSATGFVEPSTPHRVNVSFDCNRMFHIGDGPDDVVAGVQLGTMRATIMKALNGLRS